MTALPFDWNTSPGVICRPQIIPYSNQTIIGVALVVDVQRQEMQLRIKDPARPMEGDVIQLLDDHTFKNLLAHLSLSAPKLFVRVAQLLAESHPELLDKPSGGG
jgi:hypothetical protein